MAKSFEKLPNQTRTLTGDTYHRLRSDIVSGILKPGEKLRAEHLKRDYGVSAATLREALALLVADALVVSQQQRGFRVADMSVADFRDITNTRIMLETYAVKQSIRHGDDDWEADLSAAFHKLSRAEERRENIEEGADYWESCNKKFHETLVASCNSPRTMNFLEILYRQSERYRRLSIFNLPIDRDVHEEHSEIFKAAMNRDELAVSAAIEKHIRATFNIINTIEDGPDGTIMKA